MKFMHLADLHIGKNVNGFSMIEDQKYILLKILQIAEEERPDAVLIAGDVYDRQQPAEEAVSLFDDFLVRLSAKTPHVVIISGNHDSAVRVAFGGRLMDRSGVHFSPVYDGKICPVKLQDEYGEADIWPIPFLKPVHVRRFFEDAPIQDFNDAMKVVIGALPIDPEKRNIAVAHQFLTGGATCQSEEKSVGGLDDISAEVFSAFDYVALGHLHGPQQIGRETVRYAGSPLKYSFSEAGQMKSVTMVELFHKGEVQIRTIPLTAAHDMIRIRGTFQELMKDPEKKEDYYEVTLTDEEDIPEAMNRMRAVYPNLMLLQYDNTRTRSQQLIRGTEEMEKKTPLELFNELYESMNGTSLSEQQQLFLNDLIREIWEDKV